MNQILAQLLASPVWQTRMKKIGLIPPRTTNKMVTVTGNLYENRPDPLTILFECWDTNNNSLYVRFVVRINVLQSSCGVLEFNRPNRTCKNQEHFNFFMDLVCAGLKKRKRNAPSSCQERWGNQIIATTSSESSPYYKVWCRTNNWMHCGNGRNPRTGHKITVWKKVL